MSRIGACPKLVDTYRFLLNIFDQKFALNCDSGRRFGYANAFVKTD